ncbi:MAG: NAD-dependent protein deacylase [Myxococcales bacterium]|nr:NAD-dependent protein deacylase [Myxococcales bacterium]
MSFELPRELVHRLRAARSVGAITGAGISAESGIRPYRGKGGIYDDPSEGEATVEAVSAPTLYSDPDRTWRAIAAIARGAAGARPNAAHEALVAIENAVERFALLTQNVDGLHQAAGSKAIIDIHGSVDATICMRCDTRAPLDVASIATLERAPRCAQCSIGVLRPDVVLFGEMLPMDKVARMQREFHENVPDVVIIAGTSALFPYIAEPLLVARKAGKLTIEVNLEPTDVTVIAEFSFRERAGAVLPAIAEAINLR